jgi:hypothetical protein
MIAMTVKLIPLENTTPREIRALRNEVEDAVRRMRGVGCVAPIHTDAPVGSKGIAEDVGAFLVGIPPSIIAGVLESIKAILLRPAQPQTKVKITAAGIELEFDPKRVSLDEMATFVDRLRATGSSV